jgi:hypothetical protein
MKTFAQIVTETWHFFLNHWLGITKIIAPFIVPLNIAYVALEFSAVEQADTAKPLWLTMGFGIAVYPIYQAAFIAYMAAAVANSPINAQQFYRIAVQCWPRLMLVYILTTAAIALGLTLLIVPGFIVMARLSFAEFYCLFESAQPIDAIRKSWEKTRVWQWEILKGLLLIIALTSIPIWVLEAAFESVNLWNPLFALLLGIAASILGTLTTIFAFRVYTLENENRVSEQSSNN